VAKSAKKSKKTSKNARNDKKMQKKCKKLQENARKECFLSIKIGHRKREEKVVLNF